LFLGTVFSPDGQQRGEEQPSDRYEQDQNEYLEQVLVDLDLL
jgi:hypothetical protein